MLLQRLNHSFPVVRVRDEVDRLFDNLIDSAASFDPFRVFSAPTFPAINIWEEDKALHVEAELPGVNMQDLRLSVLGNELTIEGERRSPTMENGTFHRQERGMGKFTRVIHLPVEVDADKVEASLRDGVLTVHLPKSPAALPRRIEVKS